MPELLEGHLRPSKDLFHSQSGTPPMSTSIRSTLSTLHSGYVLYLQSFEDLFLTSAKNNFVINSKNVTYNNININAHSYSVNQPSNSDGWDIYRSDGVTIKNSNVNNYDDCVSFKPNTTNALVENMICNGSVRSLLTASSTIKMLIPPSTASPSALSANMLKKLTL
jgi:hypothetical protein